MRLQAWIAGGFVSTLSLGCAAVFSISPGEYDPDPFDREAGSGGGTDASTGAGASSGGGVGAGAGGDAPGGGPEVPPCTALLDDLEDGDGEILPCLDRAGSWYTYNDDSRGGTQTPLPGRPFLPISPGYGTSQFAAHVAGSGFTSRGAGMGFDLNFGANGVKSSYDASAYTGLSFWAKAVAPTHIYVNFPDRDTDILGGVCTGTGCDDHYGDGLDITTEWAKYTVKFAELSPDGWGTPKPAKFDPAHVYSVEFHTAKTTVFDFLVDDIAFVP